MKKVKSIVLPILVLPFFVSCNNSKVNYKVTKDEFEHAISFKGIEYAQETFIEKEPGTEDKFEVSEYTCSPNVYRDYDYVKTLTSDIYPYCDTVVTKDNDVYTVYEKDYDTEPEVEPEWERKTGTEKDFETPEIFFAATIKEYLEESTPTGEPLTYNDFEYKADKKAYVFSYSAPVEGLTTSFEYQFMFKNRKIVSLVYIVSIDGTEIGNYKHHFSYEEIIPDVPVVPKI